MNERLLAILLGWRAGLLRRGLPEPDEGDLRTIAMSNRVWPAGALSAVTEAWKDVIQYLEHQQRMGVVDPVDNMSNAQWELPAALRLRAVPDPDPTPTASLRAMRPAPAADAAAREVSTPDAAPADPVATIMAELRRWAQAKNAASPGSISLPEPRLKQLAASTPVTRPRIVQSFRLTPYAAEIDAIFAALSPGAQRSTTPSASSPAGAASSSEAPDQRPASLPSSAPTQDVDPHGFAAYDYGPEQGEPQPLSVSVSIGKNLLVSWQPPEDGAAVHVYRVVAGDDEEPWSPESGRLVAATLAEEVEDAEDFAGAVRHLQVWCNSGRTVQEAKRAQPRCIATKAVVSPVREVRLSEEAGTVTGEWDVFDRIERVLVYRVPRDKRRQGSQSPLYQIEIDDENLRGFQDSGAVPGQHYLYQIVAETTVDGVRLTSAPVNHEQQISIVLERVRDLQVVRYAENDIEYFDLSWTPPPGGRVSIYRAQQRPTAGIEDEGELSEAALEGAGLSERVKHPVRPDAAAGRDVMRRVPWPPAWSRAYFTPVTVLNGQAVVGDTQTTTRVPAVHPQLIERVNEQLLTFAWPAGAASVKVFQTRRGMDAGAIDPATARADYEISRDEWVAQGGKHCVPPLPPNGCAVHLFAVAWQQARPEYSAPATIDYPGLRVLRYDISEPPRRTMDRLGRRTLPRLTIQLLTPGAMPPLSFVLVARADRLPLDATDGRAVALRPAEFEDAEPTTMITPGWAGDRAVGEWVVDLSPLGGVGFVRLFPVLPPDQPAEHIRRIALLDPPIGALLAGRP